MVQGQTLRCLWDFGSSALFRADRTLSRGCRDIVPIGQRKSGFNYNLDEKRVLNFVNEVKDDDNIKQDISIDVYGREKPEDAAPETVAAAPEPVSCSSRP